LNRRRQDFQSQTMTRVSARTWLMWKHEAPDGLVRWNMLECARV